MIVAVAISPPPGPTCTPNDRAGSRRMSRRRRSARTSRRGRTATDGVPSGSIRFTCAELLAVLGVEDAELVAVDDEADAEAVLRPGDLLAVLGAGRQRCHLHRVLARRSRARASRTIRGRTAPCGRTRCGGASAGRRGHQLLDRARALSRQIAPRRPPRGRRRAAPRSSALRVRRTRGRHSPLSGHCVSPCFRPKPQAFIMPTWQSEKSKRTGSRGSRLRSEAVMSAAICQPGLV